MDKISFLAEDGNEVWFYVLEQTRIGGTDYILVTENEEGDGEALILKDVSGKDDVESVYEIVEDDRERNALAAVFENMMDDIAFETDGETDRDASSMEEE